MKRVLLVMAMCLVAILSVNSAAWAFFFGVDYVTGVLNESPTLEGFSTTGNEMAGMQLIATFDDNSTDYATWVAIPSYAGRAQGTGWDLYEDGDTYTQEWTLSSYLTGNKKMSTLLIDAGPGRCVFDTERNGGVNGYGTPDTYLGKAFAPRAGDHEGLTLSATYIDEVAIRTNNVLQAPVGDIYRYLLIDFRTNGFGGTRALHFVADSDELNHAGDVMPVVPEPGSMVLLTVAGVLGLLVYRRRRS
jgi:hypothetical protein